jgi:hypothetical protein
MIKNALWLIYHTAAGLDTGALLCLDEVALWRGVVMAD